jgi:nitrite reductase (cytochrome c-552)
MKKDSGKHWLWFPFGGLAVALTLVKLKKKKVNKTAEKKGSSDKGRHRWFWVIVFSTLLLLAGTGVGVLMARQYYRRHVLPSRPPATWQIQQDDPDPANWGKWFPDHYQSYLHRLERESSELPPRKVDLRPALEVLWAGFESGTTTREVRGHPYSLADVERMAPLRGNKAACLTCKSAEAPELIDELGLEFFNRPFPEMRDKVRHPVACSDCHDSETMGLRLTRQPFIEAYTKAGGNLDEIGRQEMRTLVCAQCHITYYVDPKTSEINIPWRQEPNINVVENYFSASPFREWTHSLTEADLVKLRHPDYEFFLGSNHFEAGVTCVDCHMPFNIIGNRKITSHNFAGPLTNPGASCGVCHRQSDDYLRDRVHQIQEDVAKLLSEVEEELVRGITMLNGVIGTPGADPELISRAQKLHFQSFLYYEWVHTANSKGFHNPREALTVLAKAMQLTKEMQLITQQAGGQG